MPAVIVVVACENRNKVEEVALATFHVTRAANILSQCSFHSQSKDPRLSGFLHHMQHAQAHHKSYDLLMLFCCYSGRLPMLPRRRTRGRIVSASFNRGMIRINLLSNVDAEIGAKMV